MVKAYLHICDSKLDCSSILSVRQGKVFSQALHLDLFIYRAVKMKLFNSKLVKNFKQRLFNSVFQISPKAEQFSPKFHGLVLGLVGLIDAKGIDFAQPI